MLSGGGSNGSWEAGVLWGLTHYGDANDFAYDWISGISAGAINTACLSGWAKGDEKRASEYLSYTWTTLTNKDIWAYWDVGPVRSLWESPSLLNDEPAVEFITAQTTKPYFEGGFKRDFSIGTVNISTGEETIYGRDNITVDDLPYVAMASGSIPVVFQPRLFRDNYYMDGGTLINVNIPSAINGCLSKGFREDQIILDTVMCSDHQFPTDTVGKTKHNWFRARHIRKWYHNLDSIQQWIAAYPNIQYRYLIEQAVSLDGIKEIEFGNDVTWPMQTEGRQNAQEALQYGFGFGWDKYIW